MVRDYGRALVMLVGLSPVACSAPDWNFDRELQGPTFALSEDAPTRAFLVAISASREYSATVEANAEGARIVPTETGAVLRWNLQGGQARPEDQIDVIEGETSVGTLEAACTVEPCTDTFEFNFERVDGVPGSIQVFWHVAAEISGPRGPSPPAREFLELSLE